MTTVLPLGHRDDALLPYLVAPPSCRVCDIILCRISELEGLGAVDGR